MSGAFDYINAISLNKTDMMTGTENDVLAERGYDPFLTNKAFSQYMDTVFIANEMNMNHHLDKKPQFHFYLNIVKPKKRYAEWAKKEKNTGDLLVVKEFFGYSDQKARQALTVLTEKQLDEMRERLQKGGEHDRRNG
jgi:hypothetical protein